MTDELSVYHEQVVLLRISSDGNANNYTKDKNHNIKDEPKKATLV